MVLLAFAFLGGLALFLYGMQIMGDGLQQAAGERLQKVLERLTGKIIYGVCLGAVVTGILQSSTATTVMSVGLVNAGLMTLKQAFGIIMGANIGTTLTAQLIAFKLTDYITILLFIGFLCQSLGKRRVLKSLGHVLMGFGLLMVGINMMSSSVMPLRDYPGFTEFVGRFSDNPLLGVVVGIVMTICIQSSAATIGILMAMASQGLLPLEGAIPVLFGDNIGTCLTALLATIGANRSAKRVGLTHVLFNTIGTIIFIIFLPYFIDVVLFVSPAGDIARQVANSHTAFNVLNTVLFLPFAGKFTDLIIKLVPGEDEMVSTKPEFLNDDMLGTPAIAVGLAAKEVTRMGALALSNIDTATQALLERDPAKVKYVLEHEPVIDNLEKKITEYLTKITSTNLGRELSARHTGLLHACTDIERIGDHAETLAKRVNQLEENPVSFTPEAQEELRQLSALVVGTCRLALEALEKNNKLLAEAAWHESRKAKALQKEIRKNHVMRLNAGTCSPMAGFVLMELLINLKRVSDHAKNVSQIVLGKF